MEPSRNGPPKRGSWRESQVQDRTKLLDEVAKHSDFPVHPYARITHMVRVPKTMAQGFREVLAEKVKTRAWFDAFVEHTEKRIADPLAEVEQDTVRRYETMRACMDVLERRFIRDISKTASDKQRALAEHLADIDAAIQQAAREYKKDISGSAARKSIDALRSLYQEGGPLEPSESPEACLDPGRRALTRPLMPYSPGNSNRRLWLNFWRRPGEPKSFPIKPDHELRLFWQRYPENQTFTFHEDWLTRPSHEGQNAFFARPHQNDAPASLNCDWTALESFEQRLSEFHAAGEDLSAFSWVDSLHCIFHTWCLPLTDLGLDQAGLARDEPCEINKLLEFAEATFCQMDQTRPCQQRNDLIITRLAHGQAFLVMDMRLHSRDDMLAERSSRALVLHNPERVTPAELGRMVSSLNDIETYRMLALRDLPYAKRVRRVLSEIGREVSGLESSSFESVSDPVETLTSRARCFRSLERKIKGLLLASLRITALNHFIANGVSGATAYAVLMDELIERRMTDLNEDPLRGQQNLTQYLERFRSAVDLIKQISRRYLQVRERIDEEINISRAELSRLESAENKTRTIGALIISIFIGFTGALNLIHIYLNTRTPPDAAEPTPPIFAEVYLVILLGAWLAIGGYFVQVGLRSVLVKSGLQNLWMDTWRTITRGGAGRGRHHSDY